MSKTENVYTHNSLYSLERSQKRLEDRPGEKVASVDLAPDLDRGRVPAHANAVDVPASTDVRNLADAKRNPDVRGSVRAANASLQRERAAPAPAPARVP